MEVPPLSEEEVSNPRRMINRSDGSPLVSIGIPVHNGAEHLSEAVESVLQQNYRRVEVIICDNASDDGTEQIAQSYAHRDERVVCASPVEHRISTEFPHGPRLGDGEVLRLVSTRRRAL